MNKEQLQASLAFNGETIAEAENTLRHPKKRREFLRACYDLRDM